MTQYMIMRFELYDHIWCPFYLCPFIWYIEWMVIFLSIYISRSVSSMLPRERARDRAFSSMPFSKSSTNAQWMTLSMPHLVCLCVCVIIIVHHFSRNLSNNTYFFLPHSHSFALRILRELSSHPQFPIHQACNVTAIPAVRLFKHRWPITEYMYSCYRWPFCSSLFDISSGFLFIIHRNASKRWHSKCIRIPMDWCKRWLAVTLHRWEWEKGEMHTSIIQPYWMLLVCIQ